MSMLSIIETLYYIHQSSMEFIWIIGFAGLSLITTTEFHYNSWIDVKTSESLIILSRHVVVAHKVPPANIVITAGMDWPNIGRIQFKVLNTFLMTNHLFFLNLWFSRTKLKI